MKKVLRHQLKSLTKSHLPSGIFVPEEVRWDATTYLALLYTDGWHGFSPNLDKAIKYARRLEKNDMVEGHAVLGMCYYRKYNKDKKNAKFLKWTYKHLKKAAERKHPESLLHLVKVNVMEGKSKAAEAWAERLCRLPSDGGRISKIQSDARTLIMFGELQTELKRRDAKPARTPKNEEAVDGE